jgi:hypothetical protein
MTQTDTISNKFNRAEELGLCPECGAVMNEMERLRADLRLAHQACWKTCLLQLCL